MKNYEIVNMLSGIKPESYTQWKKLRKCMLMFLKDEVGKVVNICDGEGRNIEKC